MMKKRRRLEFSACYTEVHAFPMTRSHERMLCGNPPGTRQVSLPLKLQQVQLQGGSCYGQPTHRVVLLFLHFYHSNPDMLAFESVAAAAASLSHNAAGIAHAAGTPIRLA